MRLTENHFNWNFGLKLQIYDGSDTFEYFLLLTW